MGIQINRIHIVVRDGRVGRDPSLVTDAGGQILWEYDTEDYPPADVGSRVTLPDGEEVTVIGTHEHIQGDLLTFTQHVSDSFLGDR